MPDKTEQANAAAMRISMLKTELEQINKSYIGRISREFTKNRDKLTSDDVKAAVGKEKLAELSATLNGYLPDSFSV